jgi:hypothetical protein
MTSSLTKAGGGAEGVHRLVDMVVEEVSLVDRAANNHRFLLVKRGDAMTTPTAAAEGAASSWSPSSEAIRMMADESALGAALAALESLTALVEQLGSMGTDSDEGRLAALAEQLRAAVEQMLGGAELEGPSDGAPAEPSEVEGRAPAEQGSAASSFASNLDAAKQSLARLSELASQVAPVLAEKRQATPAVAPPAQQSLEHEQPLVKLAASFGALTESVQQLHQRIARVEKQSGVPNSAGPAEQVTKASAEAVGWPLDLNEPKDRETVDKTVSFHDL